MSAHVELVQRATELATREGPRAVLARYDEFFTDDFRWTPALINTLEGGGDYVGLEGFTRYWDAFEASFSGFSYQDAIFAEVDQDTVLVKLRICVEGHESRVPVVQEVGWVFHFEGGRIASGESHMSWVEAEAAAHAQA